MIQLYLADVLTSRSVKKRHLKFGLFRLENQREKMRNEERLTEANCS